MGLIPKKTIGKESDVFQTPAEPGWESGDVKSMNSAHRLGRSGVLDLDSSLSKSPLIGTIGQGRDGSFVVVVCVVSMI